MPARVTIAQYQLHAARDHLHTNATVAALENADLAANLDRIFRQLNMACSPRLVRPEKLTWRDNDM